MTNVRSMKAIDDLNRSMNACMHAENQYLTKVNVHTCIYTHIYIHFKNRYTYTYTYLHIYVTEFF
jgi:hypothetical protein